MNKKLSAGSAEITKTTEKMKTTGSWGANHGFPKQQVWKYPSLGSVLTTPDPDTSAKTFAMQWEAYVIEVVYALLSNNRKRYSCQNIVIQIGVVSRFS